MKVSPEVIQRLKSVNNNNIYLDSNNGKYDVLSTLNNNLVQTIIIYLEDNNVKYSTFRTLHNNLRSL